MNFNPGVALTVGSEVLYVLSFLQSTGKNALFVQGTESVGCEKSCSYLHVQRDGSEPFQPAWWDGEALTSCQISCCFDWEGEEQYANECFPFELIWSCGCTSCCFCLINLINLSCCSSNFNWGKIN